MAADGGKMRFADDPTRNSESADGSGEGDAPERGEQHIAMAPQAPMARPPGRAPHLSLPPSGGGLLRLRWDSPLRSTR